MKRFWFFPMAFILSACNNANKQNNSGEGTVTKSAAADQTATATPITASPGSFSGTKIFVEGREMDLSGSLLVQKDKENLQRGAAYLAPPTGL
jgi:hypothetical protein